MQVRKFTLYTDTTSTVTSTLRARCQALGAGWDFAGPQTQAEWHALADAADGFCSEDTVSAELVTGMKWSGSGTTFNWRADSSVAMTYNV